MYFLRYKNFKQNYCDCLRNVPSILIRILCFWYRSQEICILWGNSRPSLCTIFSGVRQGGILSPKLFSVYIDDLSKLLINSGIGCFIDNACFNHVFYADDLYLMAPCAISLEELLLICYSYSISVDVNFNPLKSLCIGCHSQILTLTLLIFHTQILSNI